MRLTCAAGLMIASLTSLCCRGTAGQAREPKVPRVVVFGEALGLPDWEFLEPLGWSEQQLAQADRTYPNWREERVAESIAWRIREAMAQRVSKGSPPPSRAQVEKWCQQFAAGTWRPHVLKYLVERDKAILQELALQYAAENGQGAASEFPTLPGVDKESWRQSRLSYPDLPSVTARLKQLKDLPPAVAFYEERARYDLTVRAFVVRRAGALSLEVGEDDMRAAQQDAERRGDAPTPPDLLAFTLTSERAGSLFDGYIAEEIRGGAIVIHDPAMTKLVLSKLLRHEE